MPVSKYLLYLINMYNYYVPINIKKLIKRVTGIWSIGGQRRTFGGSPDLKGKMEPGIVWGQGGPMQQINKHEVSESEIQLEILRNKIVSVYWA